MASFCKIFWSSYLCHLILSSTSSNLKPQIASKMLLDLSYLYIFFALKYAIYVKCDFFCLTAYSVILIMYIMVLIPFCNSNPHTVPSLQSTTDSSLLWNCISIYVRLSFNIHFFHFPGLGCLEHFENWTLNFFLQKNSNATSKWIWIYFLVYILLKFIYSEKATKFCKIFTLLLTGTT